MKLTKAVCEAAEYVGEPRQRKKGKVTWPWRVLWDDKLAGFGLRVFPSGSKSFVLKYRSAGRQHLATIGGFPLLSVDEARKRANKALVQVNDGTDPLEEKRAAKATGMTVKELADQFLERHAKIKKRTWREDELRIKRVLLKKWGRRPIASIRRVDVATLHSKIGKATPYEANKFLRLVSKMWNLAISWEFLPENASNPASKIDLLEEQKRDRWVKPDELPRLVEQIAAEPNVYVRAALTLYILLGARKGELLAAKWVDVDLARRELRLPRTKSGKTHFIALSAPAVALLTGLPREKRNPHVFPGHIKGSHLVNVDIAWRAIRTAAGLEDVRLHDLRRTAGSYLATNNVGLPIIGKILGHSSPSTTQIYARLAEDVGRRPLEDHGANVVGLMGEKAAQALGLTGEAEKKAGSA